MTRLYFGNLLYEVTPDDLSALLMPFGLIESVDVHGERAPGHHHAFAFVQMEDDAAQAAMRSLDGVDFMGLTLRVTEASLQSRVS